MHIRDAAEGDADTLAAIGDAPVDVMRNLVHDRTVRVAVRSEPDATGDGSNAFIVGYISFDAERDDVYITQLNGDSRVFHRLLEEPIRFAKREGMGIELLAASNDDGIRQAAESVGFELIGSGPSFRSEPTDRYRIDCE